MTITEIVANIDARLAAAQAELARLGHARTALLNTARPADAPTPTLTPTAMPTETPRRARRRPAKTTYDTVPVGKLTALLSGSEGLRTKQLSLATNGDPGQILALLKEQETAGEVRRSGTRASTRWHLITDEDRIAARAAELRAQSSQSSRKRARTN